MDKRLIGDQIRQIQKRLKVERANRGVQRDGGLSCGCQPSRLYKRRQVGLFQCFDQTGVYAADKLFATLDPPCGACS